MVASKGARGTRAGTIGPGASIPRVTLYGTSLISFFQKNARIPEVRGPAGGRAVCMCGLARADSRAMKRFDVSTRRVSPMSAGTTACGCRSAADAIARSLSPVFRRSRYCHRSAFAVAFSIALREPQRSGRRLTGCWQTSEHGRASARSIRRRACDPSSGREPCCVWRTGRTLPGPCVQHMLSDVSQPP